MNMETATARKAGRPWLKLAVAMAATLIGFLLVEIGLRLFARVPHPYTVDGKADSELIFSELRRHRINRYIPFRHTNAHRVYYPNPAIVKGLPGMVNYTTDQFGFRGPRPVALSKDPEGLRVIAVGGSTTECKSLDDTQTWPELVYQKLKDDVPGLEVINAGFSGENSRDHIALVSQRLVPFKPDIILFLVGINDLELQMKPDYSPLREDRRSLVEESSPSPTSMMKVLVAHYSHVCRLAIFAKRRYIAADERGNPVMDAGSEWIKMMREKRRRLPVKTVDLTAYPKPEYEQNLRSLIGIARANGIEPVFLTQPVIWGAPPGDWESILWVHPDPRFQVSHQQLWQLMESFNDVIRRVAEQERVRVIDLARKVPKTTEVFFDDDHFTIAGAELVSRIVATELRPFLRRSSD